MKNVLLVDDEQSFLLSLTDMFKDCSDKFAVLTAGNGKEAIEVLEKNEIHLVVTDLKMPELDGFGLLSHMSKTTPNIPIIAMTAFGTPDMEDQLLDMGAFQYIEKPIEFDLLLSKIEEGLTAGITGHVAGISTASFLQLLEMERKTCTLTVHSEGRTGNLFFRQGEMINAETENLEGQDAAFQIICWDHTEIDIINMCKMRKKTIDVPMGYILIESARLKDEMAHAPEDAEREAGSQDKDEKLDIDEIDFGESASQASKVKQEEIEMVIVDDSLGISDVETADHFLEVLAAIDGINWVVGVSRKGERIGGSEEKDPKLEKYLGMVVDTAGEFSRGYDFGRMEYSTISQMDGLQLTVLTGPEIILAIEFNAEAKQLDIIKEIRPAINRITTS